MAKSKNDTPFEDIPIEIDLPVYVVNIQGKQYFNSVTLWYDGKFRGALYSRQAPPAINYASVAIRSFKKERFWKRISTYPLFINIERFEKMLGKHFKDEGVSELIKIVRIDSGIKRRKTSHTIQTWSFGHITVDKKKKTVKELLLTKSSDGWRLVTGPVVFSDSQYFYDPNTESAEGPYSADEVKIVLKQKYKINEKMMISQFSKLLNIADDVPLIEDMSNNPEDHKYSTLINSMQKLHKLVEMLPDPDIMGTGEKINKRKKM